MLKKYLLPLLLLFTCSCTCLGGKKDELPKKVTVMGRIYFRGGDSFTDIGLNAFDGRMLLLLAEDDKLKEMFNFQNEVVAVTGYIDAKINNPQKSLIVDDYSKVELTEVSGKLYKSGSGIKLRFYLQTPEKTYEVVTEKSILLEKELESMVEIKGYPSKMVDSIDQIFVESVVKVKKQ